MTLAPTDWTLVAAFLAVCRGGSLSAAARRLGLSQPTVRRHVEDLEARLGAALFTRGPTGLLPTPTARLLVPHAEAMEAAAGAFAQLAAIRAGVAAGIAQVQLAHGLVRLLPDLAPAMPAWVVMHEDLRRVARIRAVFDHLVAALA